MNYSEIISSSFRLAWQNKSLWLLGLFSSGYGLYSFQSTFDLDSEHPWIDLSGLGGYDFSLGGWLSAAALLVVLLMAATAVFLTALCTPAIIDAVNRLSRGGRYSLGASFAAGFRFLGRALGVLILHFLVYIAFFAITVPLGALALLVHPLLLVAAVLTGIPLLMLFVFAAETVFQLAYRAMVVRDIPIAAALREGLGLLGRYPGPCAILFLLHVGLYIVTAMIAAGAIVVMAIPFVLLAMSSSAGLIAALAIGIPLFWLVSLPAGGFLGAVFETMYTLFYFRLLEPIPAGAPATA